MDTTFLIASFLIGSLVLGAISRKSLLLFRSHGFYRFFAWEILLGMVLLNVKDWFIHPLAWHQLVSWVLLVLSLVLVIAGLSLLRRIGQTNQAREDAALLGMEKTSRLVTVGLYRYIRHPLYSSLFFLAWGIFFKSPSWLDAGLALTCSVFLCVTARMEEHENIAYFGQEYVEYMKRTRMFIPNIF